MVISSPWLRFLWLPCLDFLPLFVWVLAHSNFVSAEIEAEYIWGLAHPSLFNGEGGYYLTTLTSAGNYYKAITHSLSSSLSLSVNVLRELCSDTYNAENFKTLPKTSSLKSELQVYSCLGPDPLKVTHSVWNHCLFFIYK